jgi:hypothetical protein
MVMSDQQASLNGRKRRCRRLKRFVLSIWDLLSETDPSSYGKASQIAVAIVSAVQFLTHCDQI